MPTLNSYDSLLRLVRAARGLEAGGFYGAAKLLWALAYSEEIQASNEVGIPRGTDLDHEISSILETLKADGKDPAIIRALEGGQEAVRRNTSVLFDVIPDVHVSRTTGELFLGKPPEFSVNNDHRLGLREFAAVWYFDFLTPQQALEALEASPDLIEQQIRGLNAEQFLIAPAPGEWNMHELLAHILNAQQLAAGRIERLLTEDNPNLASASTWAVNDNHSLSPAEILEDCRDSRQQMVERLRGIALADWWRPGWHTEFGSQTVLSQATYFAQHELSHMPQFAQIRRAAEKT